MLKCGVFLLSLDDIPVTRITSTVSAPTSEELQAKQGKLIPTIADITLLKFSRIQ